MIEQPEPLKTKPAYWSQIIFMVVSSAVLLYGIFYLQKNFFFIIYIFWFEALIRTVFNYFRIRNAGKDITVLPENSVTINKRELTLADYNNRPYYARFYVFGSLLPLFIYWVFIIVMVGFVFAFTSKNNDMLMQNIRIMVFSDRTFLLALFVFFAKSLNAYYSDYILGNGYKNADVLSVGSIFNRQNLVMHISLIIGVGCWFLVQRELPAYSNYIMSAMATVFVVIKLIADIYDYHRTAKK